MGSRFHFGTFLKIAQEISENENINDEGWFRTCIGRAYYAAFLIIRSRLQIKGKSFEREKQHKTVREYLKDLNQDPIADQLETLFDYRVDSDYYSKPTLHPGITINRTLCEKCIRISEWIIESSEEI